MHWIKSKQLQMIASADAKAAQITEKFAAK